YGLAALDDTERAEDEGEVSSDIRQELDAAKPWIEGFLLSEHRRKVPGGDEDVADDLDLLLFTLFAHHAPDLRFTGAADIAKFMTETLPREIASEAEDFGRFGVLLPAFFLHLADGGAFPFAADCALEAERRAPEMIRRAADPARWSADKARMMDVLRAGVDPADPRALARWMRDRGWDSGDDPGDALEGLPRVPPIVRETRFTEPGPYDPCPCGSGEKYKFCCKKKKA
ncbi:MAG: SEC-C domain-containing protein, partial [Planctomycetes bacterium]|nr:SEC-C domain-containing protein [Planctomycetota bacterium]